MRWMLALAVALGFAGSAFAQEAEAPDDPAPARPLRVLSYNIKHGLGMDGRLDLERIAARIVSWRPDVVCLQEVDRGCARSGGVDQARFLADRCGMQAVFGAFMDYDGGEYGMAVLSRLPVQASRNLRLPDGAEPRSALRVDVRAPGGRPIGIVGVHLYRSTEERCAQAQSLIEAFAGDPRPCVLFGDFNSRREGPVLELLRPHWLPAGKLNGPGTFPADRPEREIDFLLLPRDGSVACAGVRVVDEALVSDHRPLLAELRLPPAEEASEAQAALLDLALRILAQEDEDDREDLLEELSSLESRSKPGRGVFERVEEALRSGRGVHRPAAPAAERSEDGVDELRVALHDASLATAYLGRAPEAPGPAPLLIALHGGPPASAEQARRAARRMLRTWEGARARGWQVLAPALESCVVRGERGPDRLPFEVLRPEDLEAFVDAVHARRSIDLDRVFVTGVSLGANFSLGLAVTSDRLAGIVPVSTEGEFRPAVLQNSSQIPALVLEGALDRNIRDIALPRAMARWWSEHSVDAEYREFADRGHEAFDDQLGRVLEWMEDRRRDPWRPELRILPCPGLYPSSRHRAWLSADLEGCFVHARRAGDQRLAVDVVGARRVVLRMNDRLVDLDRPVEVVINGVAREPIRVTRSLSMGLRAALEGGDPGRLVANQLELRVPDSEEAQRHALAARAAFEEGAEELPLPYWESFAAAAQQTRAPQLGIEGVLFELPAEHSRHLPPGALALRLEQVDAQGVLAAAGARAGDVLLSLGGFAFTPERGLEQIQEELGRRLRATPTPVPVLRLREGRPSLQMLPLALSPWR